MNPFYKSGAWRRKRTQVLKRDGYMCVLSKRYGKRVAATTVHHIYPLEEYPEYRLCGWNLISLCASAHDSLHDRNTGKLTEEGLRLQRRTVVPGKAARQPPRPGEKK